MEEYDTRARSKVAAVIDFFEDFQDYERQRSYRLQLDRWAIRDPIGQAFLLRAQDQSDSKKYSLRVINCSSFEDDVFKAGVYELSLHERLSGCRQVAQLKDSFILFSPQAQARPVSLVMLFEHVEFSLGELISYKREREECWLEGEYNALLNSCFLMLHELKQAQVAHRDFRPYNICYSSAKKTFLLTNFSSGINLAPDYDKLETHSLRGAPLFLPAALSE